MITLSCLNIFLILGGFPIQFIIHKNISFGDTGQTHCFHYLSTNTTPKKVNQNQLTRVSCLHEKAWISREKKFRLITRFPFLLKARSIFLLATQAEMSNCIPLKIRLLRLLSGTCVRSHTVPSAFS